MHYRMCLSQCKNESEIDAKFPLIVVISRRWENRFKVGFFCWKRFNSVFMSHAYKIYTCEIAIKRNFIALLHD